MFTVGIDSIEIERVKKSLRSKRFIDYVYGKNELTEMKEKGFPAQTAAASFAVKEAFGKALGTGIRGFKLCEVELLHNSFGGPVVQLSGSAEKIADERNLVIKASITHTKTTATAIVVAYKRGNVL